MDPARTGTPPPAPPATADSATPTQFARSLGVSIQLIERLETALLDEARAIASRDSLALQRSVDGKQELVTQLEAETHRQRHWVELARQPFTPAGMTKFFATLGSDGQLPELWSRLRDSSARCDRLNRANARLIERDRRRVAATLRIMSGDDGASKTYNPRGQTESAGLRGRTFTQA